MRINMIKTIILPMLALLIFISGGCGYPGGLKLFEGAYIKTAGGLEKAKEDGGPRDDSTVSEGCPAGEGGTVNKSGIFTGRLPIASFKTPVTIVAERASVEKRTVLKGENAAALEHGSDYDISGFTTADGSSHNFIYEQLGDLGEDLAKYRFDEAVTAQHIDAGDSDAISGRLLSDKVIDLYYGYGFKVTVNYLDKYTGEPIKTSFVSEEIENGTGYDFRSRLLAEIESGGKRYLYSLGSCEKEALLAGNISGDTVIDIYYGYYDSLTVNYLSKYDNSPIKTSFSNTAIEHLSSYDCTSLLVDEIEKDGITYLYSLGSCDREDLLSGTIDGSVEITVYYGYYNRVTVLFLDKYEYEAGSICEIMTAFTEDVEHLDPYDFGSVLDGNLTIEKNGIKYIFRDGDSDNGFIELGEVRTGLLRQDSIEADETVEIVYGYLHSIVINYRDKYTGEIIHRETVTYDEKYTAYDKTTNRLDSIDYNDTDYYYAASSGDGEKGVLDTDKSIVFNYAYDNSVTVYYREKATGEELAESLTGTQEHFTAYDYTGTTMKLIDGYERLPETTGDSPAGDMLDTDKQVTVWYTRNPVMKSVQPETGDSAIISIPEIIILAASVAVIIVSAVLLIVKRKNRKSGSDGKR
ncbi:MAG: hypothetical protein ILO53_01605 [Clostridia bacterium]|nr:hypothetical protein [Clostridia bacterium]